MDRFQCGEEARGGSIGEPHGKRNMPLILLL